jgi:VanZ family protein
MIIRYTWPALIWSLIVLILTLIPGEAVPDVDIVQIDKVVHFFIFGVLMILSSYALLKMHMLNRWPANPLMISGIYSITFGSLIEVIQQFVPGRNFSLVDMLANTIGVVLGYAVVIFLRRKNVLK